MERKKHSIRLRIKGSIESQVPNRGLISVIVAEEYKGIPEKCPAFGHECIACKKPNHLASVCIGHRKNTGLNRWSSYQMKNKTQWSKSFHNTWRQRLVLPNKPRYKKQQPHHTLDVSTHAIWCQCRPRGIECKLHDILGDLDGVDVLLDDILVTATGDTIKEADTDHDANLLELLQRARKVNLSLTARSSTSVTQRWSTWVTSYLLKLILSNESTKGE